MARCLRHFLCESEECSYLPERPSSLEYRMLTDVRSDELDHLLERGWRHFGPAFFRPTCDACAECVPLRIPVASFRPSRQQRRVARATRGWRVVIGPPAVDDRRIDLYHRWHAAREVSRGWSDGGTDAAEYGRQFAHPSPCAREFSYFDESATLVAVAIVDETPMALSAVYTFFDPAFAKCSPGTASILFQIDHARRMEKRWLYLGYCIRGCPSSVYKARFGPHEVLQTRPALDEPAHWMPRDIA